MLSRDDIIRMAREAGLYEDGKFFVLEHSELERFFKTAYEAGATAEREACAKARAERWGQEVGVETWGMAGKDCAAAIRARGNK